MNVNCQKCGAHIDDISERGAWLNRVSPKGQDFVGECAPSCEHKHGGQSEALLGALEGSTPPT